MDQNDYLLEVNSMNIQLSQSENLRNPYYEYLNVLVPVGQIF